MEGDVFTNGQVLNVNRGPRKAEDDDEAMGFGYCQACNRWLVSDKALDEHSEAEQAEGAARLEALRDRCQSELERAVLDAIADRGLRLPDEAQKTLYDGDEPIAEADFYYDDRVVVFVDGSPHHRDYVQAADRAKRRRLKALGYRITVVEAPGDLAELERKVA